MDSTSATTFVASLAFQEIDYFVMLVMTAFIGWRISEMVRLHFKKLSKSKASKLCKNKLPGDDEIPYTADSAQMNLRIPPTQTPAARSAVHKPAGLEQPVSGIRPPPGLQLPSLKPQWAQEAPAMDDAPWKKIMASGTPVASREDSTPRQLGRVVCFKDTGYGFLVDEAGERLFVRQAEVEGGENLRAGQLVWFRRGRQQPNQAVKALNITLVTQEAARVMRQNGGTGPMHAATVPKAHNNKALAFPPAPKKELVIVRPPTIEPPKVPASSDDDLCAFLGAGSKEEQIKNLKYAPQWVADKFWSQQGQQQ